MVHIYLFIYYMVTNFILWTQGTEKINDEGVVETRVETVDFRSPAGKNEQEAEKRDVVVVHQNEDSGTGTGGGRNVFVDAAAAVASKVRPGKDDSSGGKQWNMMWFMWTYNVVLNKSTVLVYLIKEDVPFMSFHFGVLWFCEKNFLFLVQYFVGNTLLRSFDPSGFLTDKFILFNISSLIRMADPAS